MHLKRFWIAAAAALAVAQPALAVESKLSAHSDEAPDAVWSKIGDFCGIGNWHPAVEKCTLSANGKERTLALKGGGTIVEKLEKWDARHHAYSYAIVSGPLPVKNYHSTLQVKADKGGSLITWSGHYGAKGASDADARKAIDGVYDAGLKALAPAK